MKTAGRGSEGGRQGDGDRGPQREATGGPQPLGPPEVLYKIYEEGADLCVSLWSYERTQI